MATFSFSVDAGTILDTPTASGFESLVDAQLAPLLSHLIKGIAFNTDDQARNSRELRLTVTYSDGESAITTPFQMRAFSAKTPEELSTLVQAFFDANTTYFFSQIYTQVVTNTARRSTIIYGVVIYNTSATDGASHFAGSGAGGGGGGGSPTGPAGGDLSGTYPNPLVGPVTHGQIASGALPASLTVLNSQATASYQDVEWETVVFKGNTRRSSTIRANIGDGVTPGWVEDGIAITPAVGGTFDFTINVDISGGNMRLTITPATTGWAARTRARALAV